MADVVDVVVQVVDEAVKQEKSDYIQAMYDEHGQALLEYLLREFPNIGDVREIAQEAWLRIYCLDNPESLSDVKAHVFNEAHQLASLQRRQIRIESLHQQEQTQEISNEANEASVDSTVEHWQRITHLGNALNQLPPKGRQAFMLNRSEGLTYEAIAKKLGISTSMVEKYMMQAIKHLRDQLRHTKE